MKITRLFAVLLLAGACASPRERGVVSPTRAEIIKDPPVSKACVLEIEATLADPADSLVLPPYCGVVLFETTFNYRVLTVHEGICTDSIIGIRYSCPREMVESGTIKNDTVYRMRLHQTLRMERRLVDGKFEEVPVMDYEEVR